ncbi:MAG: hypothetical protein ILA52_02890, partial [Alphaproteobacteria bacterium]|nr:hypothetical protein [Alphaproteobacteria bacterium]
MRYTRSALGLLNKQYRSVLKKCFLLNLGLFALAATAQAATLTPTRGADAAFRYVDGSSDDYTFVDYTAAADGTLTPHYYKVELNTDKLSTTDKITWQQNDTATEGKEVVWDDTDKTATGIIKAELPH